MKELITNGLWWLSCLPETIAFSQSARFVEKAQRQRLAYILKANQATAFGKRYNFAAIRSFEEYREHVPLTDYEGMKAYIDDIMEGQSDILFPGIPYCLQPTGGSTAGSKFIPYSKQLRQEFQSGIAPWIEGLFRHDLFLLKGKSYWSISPSGYLDTRTSGGIRIGYQDDAEYLNPILQRLLKWVLAVPAEVARVSDLANSRYITLAFLLHSKNLAFISIWNPTFLTLLLESLEKWGAALTVDIRQGCLHPPSLIEQSLLKDLNRLFFAPNNTRANELEQVFQETKNNKQLLYSKIWPHLRVISCWVDAASMGPAKQLGDLFPQVKILPKGLLATEGVITIPKSDSPGAALAVRSHFFEFEPENSTGQTQAAWQLEKGRRYSVVLTTGGGLYRYKLMDFVEVVGYYHDCPLLSFVGKSDKLSDFYGEKLYEAHITETINMIFPEVLNRPTFAMLAPDGENQITRYTLFLAGSGNPGEGKIELWRQKVEKELCKNIHYDYCRKLGQLKEADVYWIDKGSNFAFERYFQFQQKRGQKIGDIKPVSLDRHSGWREWFGAIIC